MSSPMPEVMLRHLTVEDALAKLDQFMNDVFIGGFTSARVIHGKGTGTLRLAVRKELSQHPLAESFRPADPWEGGAGATIVRIVCK